jgi:DNA-binding response OmpR family regulator
MDQDLPVSARRVSKPTILLVDDERSYRSLVARALRKRRYRILGARDVPQAMARLTPEVALVILDVTIGMSPALRKVTPRVPSSGSIPPGFELLAKIREQHALLPVIVLSVLKPSRYEAATRRYGADLHLSKPVHPDILAGHVEELLQKAEPLHSPHAIPSQ